MGSSKEGTVTVITLGFVGLGHMGGNMAVRFLGAEYAVYGETRHRGEVRDLEREGLLWRDTPREIAEAADIVFTSVPNIEWRQVRALLEALGTVTEERNGKVRVTVGGVSEIFQTPREKDVDEELLADLRRMLARQS
jgi:3-hydroxyisobutyrate dehydrogenase-like beta-hydroxyacid dehydrogenase